MRIVIGASVIILGLIVLTSFPSKKTQKINGVSLVSPPHAIEAEKINELKSINASWVAIIPYAFSRPDQPTISYDQGQQWWGERTEGVCELIKLAKENELKIMLKPHVWVLSKGWTGDYNLDTEDAWKNWENSFSKYILHYASVADSLGVEMYCIGTEYKIPSKDRPDFWRGLTKKIRKIYGGKITYAANWDNYANITWWDEMDYIGIDSYFPLANGDDPSIEEIKKGWQPIKKNLSLFAKKWNKPILFTEYGFQSVNGGAGRHWEVDKSSANTNMLIQSNAYQATFESVWNENWFSGGFLWKWHLTNTGNKRNLTRFTPQGKPAQQVISKWYKETRN